MVNKDLGIYVHWPFCLSKCPYCDFNSHVSDQIDIPRWERCFHAELGHYAELTKGSVVRSVFFGGGTPSLMPPALVESVIAKIQSLWRVSNDVEITLEANPTSVEADKFQGFKMAGVNRVSLGVQSLRNADLKFLGRQHSVEEARTAIKIASDCFDRYSFDLIYARPDQKIEEWRDELSEALSLSNGHMSLYQLTIEKGTPFFTRHNRGEFQIPEDDLGGQFYEVTQEIMDKAHLPSYEVSNHAAKGQRSAHNMIYWQYGDYIGVGPGAHGRLSLTDGKQATRAHRAPDKWLEMVEGQGHGAHPFEEISPKQQAQEMLMMGLRITDGFDLSRIEGEAKTKTNDILDMFRVQALCEAGFLILGARQALQTTVAGRQRLNAVLDYILI